jgi:hypothetical protein
MGVTEVGFKNDCAGEAQLQFSIYLQIYVVQGLALFFLMDARAMPYVFHLMAKSDPVSKTLCSSGCRNKN